MRSNEAQEDGRKEPVHAGFDLEPGDICKPTVKTTRRLERSVAVRAKGDWNIVDRFRVVIHISITMKTATVRDLRNHFPRVAAWIAEGEPVEITKAGKLFARLVPPTPVKTPRLVKPDIMAQLKATWGDRIFSAREVAEMRAAELEGEEG